VRGAGRHDGRPVRPALRSSWRRKRLPPADVRPLADARLGAVDREEQP
jgi:hypothetical protein